MDFAAEVAGRIGIHQKCDLLVNFDTTDICFGYHGIDLHFAQVIGNHKQRGCVEAGSYCLTYIHIARDHHPVDRRVNRAIGELNLGVPQ